MTMELRGVRHVTCTCQYKICCVLVVTLHLEQSANQRDRLIDEMSFSGFYFSNQCWQMNRSYDLIQQRLFRCARINFCFMYREL